MRRTGVFLLLMMFCVSINAQTQQGIVKTRGRMVDGQLVPGTRLSGATVTLNFGNPLVSSNQGTFSFVVPATKSFSLVNATKQGYTLADPEYTRRLFSYSSKSPFYVVLEDENQRQADIKEATDKVRKTLKRELRKREDDLDELIEKNAITQSKYDSLRIELEHYRQNSEDLVREMAERYASTDYDQLDEFNHKVQMYIDNGDLQKADSMLNTKDIESMSEEIDKIDHKLKEDAEDIFKRQTMHNQAIEYKNKKIEEFASICYKRFEIYDNCYKCDSALYWLSLRLSKVSTNVNWQYDLAYAYYKYGKLRLFQSLRYLRPSLNLFEKILKNHQIIIDDSRKKRIYDIMSDIVQRIKTIEEYENAAKKEFKPEYIE